MDTEACSNVIAHSAHDLYKEMVAQEKEQTSTAANELVDDPVLEKLLSKNRNDDGEEVDYSESIHRASDIHDAPTEVANSHEELRATNRKVKSKDSVSSSEVYAADVKGNDNKRERQACTWDSRVPPYSNTLEGPSYSYPLPVPEEPSCFCSEAVADDPLPAIQDLQISGQPYPGRQLQACGYSINGTTSCYFEWVRHLEDGSVKYIDGAQQPSYLVTADDVDTYLSVEVRPLDERKRKGELVRVFANEHRKITWAADDDLLPDIEDLQIYGEPYPGRQLQACGYSINGTISCDFKWVRHLEDGSVKYIDGAKQPIYLVTADDVETYLAIEVQPLDDKGQKGELVKVFANEHRKIICDSAMQSHVENNLQNGHASYKVSLSTNNLGKWEPATLTIKRKGYSIEGSGSNGLVISEKLSQGSTVSVTHGHDRELSMFSASGAEHQLRVEDTIPEIVSVRDAIVLTFKAFVAKGEAAYATSLKIDCLCFPWFVAFVEK